MIRSRKVVRPASTREIGLPGDSLSIAPDGSFDSESEGSTIRTA
jgi:hypothetical protein